MFPLAAGSSARPIRVPCNNFGHSHATYCRRPPAYLIGPPNTSDASPPAGIETGPGLRSEGHPLATEV